MIIIFQGKFLITLVFLDDFVISRSYFDVIEVFFKSLNETVRE